jgi:hypothetical protein
MIGGWLGADLPDASKLKIEILVLRHQLAVIPRRTPRPRMSWAARTLIAELTD